MGSLGHEEGFRPTYNVPKTLPSLSAGEPSTAAAPLDQNANVPFRTKFMRFFYNKQTGQILGRTCKSWVCILAYSIIYLLFLITFTLIVLYSSLEILKVLIDFKNIDKFSSFSYSEPIVGLTAAPTSEHNSPLIWYKNGESNGYKKYVEALDKLLSKNRRKREISNLGPCGERPYGYGEEPCVIIRINKRLNWAGHPLQFNSTITKSAPADVQTWMKADRTKLWLQCEGYHSYDKEHIGKIKYYPDPPGIDANVFPLRKDEKSPLVAIQISKFTIGISLAIQCALWYDAGPSTIGFVLYVAPGERKVYSLKE
ncbi:hypothetical protein HW555_011404 [Spodoptera exigua]|uniref:Sodium/potassium-transporting ATPase subunit beta-1 n=1 Tax=Spodoptera exigua TaxID=7107 RepID=A0A835G721_SPOEX|nr:hypothetical protein HW555_011404 [Spodoptera exigua]